MRIQLYVLRQLLLSVAFALAGLSVIVLPTIAIQAVNKLGAISAGTVARYLPLVVVELVPYLLPMAFLLAVVATYGRLAAERELIAIKMAGIHPARLALPGFLVALPMAFATDRLLGEVSPELKYQQRKLVTDADLSRLKGAMAGRNVLSFGKNVLKSEGNRGNVRINVELDMERDGQRFKVVAAEARIDFEGEGRDAALVVRLKDAVILTEEMSVSNAVPVITWPIAELFPYQPKDPNQAKYLKSSVMRAELGGAALEPEKRAQFHYEIHRRHALSATYLLFLLLGLPTGLVLRSSTHLGAFTGAVGYAFLYYVLAMRLGKVLGATGAVPPLLAAWATNGLFLVVGLFLSVRALWR
ncbi:MAG: YjgP/YjgQ family permease [Planctomycetes bacterium]|nr:YjgP/YjgQ family permease [Planctomycetota bacterium]